MLLSLDSIDRLILSELCKNSRQDAAEISDRLKSHGHKLSESKIESRIKKLEHEGVITGYTVSVDPKKIGRRVIRVALGTFKNSQHLPTRIEGLKKYLADAPFVLFASKTRGGYDWISVQTFPSEEMADEEGDVFKNVFGDIIQVYEEYDCVPLKDPSVHALAFTEKEYRKFLGEWNPPFLP
jgi:Lrp/AsnC family leucine-responsive transcriptional regulator